MSDKDKKDLKASLREAELSDQELEDVAGGALSCDAGCQAGCAQSCLNGGSGGSELE